jgi:hypothetical protein
MTPSTDCIRAISRFLRVPTATMDIRVANVARQGDGRCCRLYAIANAQVLLQGKDPRNIVYKQSLMREHLVRCLETRIKTEMPMECFRTVRKPFVKVLKYQVFCVCRVVAIQAKEDMVQCSFCSEWFHIACAGISDATFLLHCQQKQLEYKCDACNVLTMAVSP